jgi:hydrogenase/urease accessory protein HupE
MKTPRASPLCLLLALAGVTVSLQAHEVRPGYLQIDETTPQHFAVLWKQPTQGSIALRLIPHVTVPGQAGDWLQAAPSEYSAAASYALKRWNDLPASGLDGAIIGIDGLDSSITDVLLRVTLRDGQVQQHLLSAAQPQLVLELRRQRSEFTWSYLWLGIEHILTGPDHLLFVFGLMLLVAGRWQLLQTVTAFTLAHSLTLVATAMGWISVQFRLIEALVALSIVCLAVELAHLQRGERNFTARHPWVIAFAFGLLHGCAFAGALRDIGLPSHAVIPALLLFNLGVEAGQLLFIVAASGILWSLRQLPVSWPASTRWVAPYAIGCCAVVWMLQRMVNGA